ncbi:hypothetical protein E1B28_009496 [Marasmius oreades]|uniref:Major facilitator superfamily (MFS) profile domain-containing protein n=1 Tax=Marasmius oreades TaxID=181124 RepID=A0A9P7UQ64_9AGAR|nr:uncharacterized protein E1B28_009496 [Marasmius oreades]KAG7090377.1 hypothetical protein E1B28_009496 [Marasmius oreades]
MPSFEAPTNASNEPKSSGETPVEGLEKTEKVGNTEAEVLRGPKLVVVCVAFSLAFFLIALDQTILSTALPSIASDFDAVSELSWIASGYFLPQAAFMLFFGKVLAFTSPNVVLLVSIAIFELGSLLSALSPTIFALIFGRVISGIGASALFIAVMSLIARITTLKQRPLMMSIIGAVFAASSLGGPVIGGAFSDNITWR